jgi:hypothetical protein
MIGFTEQEIQEQDTIRRMVVLSRVVGSSTGSRRNRAMGKLRRLSATVPADVLVCAIGVGLSREVRNG